jgi:alpha-tubulin suppressor-like RCC1 family protein
VRLRRFHEAPCIAAGDQRSLFVDEFGHLLASGEGAATGHGNAETNTFLPTPVAAMAGICVRSLAAGSSHSLVLCGDGRVCAMGRNNCGQLGQGDRFIKRAPVLVKGLEGVRSIAAADCYSLAVAGSGAVFFKGRALLREADIGRPILVERFGEGVRMGRVCAGSGAAFGIGEAGEFFWWGRGEGFLLGHGDEQDQPSPKRVEALRGIPMSSVSVGMCSALALTEDGLLYFWTIVFSGFGIALPTPVGETLRGVRVTSVAAAYVASYALADTGELLAFGYEDLDVPPIGHGELEPCFLPKPIEALRGVKVAAVAAAIHHTLARADDGSVYSWGDAHAAKSGALGMRPSVSDAPGVRVPTPQRILALRVGCGL